MNISKVKRFFGFTTEEENLERYNEVLKSFEIVNSEIDQLASDYFIEKSNYDNRLGYYSGNDFIVEKLENRFKEFLSTHKDSIRKAKKKYNSLKKEKENLESEDSIQKALLERGEIEANKKKQQAYQNIKKSYQNGDISLESFNQIIKGITKSEVTKYADFILFNENGEILLLKRSSWEDNNAGAWVLPGGHVDPGEDFKTAAIRELNEESGYNVNYADNVGSYEDDHCHIEYYQSQINTNEQSQVLQMTEARDCKWIPLCEIECQEMVFNMRENLMKILGLEETGKSKEIIRKDFGEDQSIKNKIEVLKKSLKNDLISVSDFARAITFLNKK